VFLIGNHGLIDNEVLLVVPDKPTESFEKFDLVFFR